MIWTMQYLDGNLEIEGSAIWGPKLISLSMGHNEFCAKFQVCSSNSLQDTMENALFLGMGR